MKLTVKIFNDTIETDFDEQLLKGDKVYYLKNDEIVAVIQQTDEPATEDDDIDEDNIDKIEGGVIVNEV